MLERRRIRGDLIETFKILTDIEKVDKEQFFFEFSDTGYYLIGHSKRLSVNRCRLDFRKYISSATEWCVIGMGLQNRLSMHSQLTPSRIAWTAIGKIWAFKEYSSHP